MEVETAVNEEAKARADIQDQIATSERKGSDVFHIISINTSFVITLGKIKNHSF